MSLTKVTYSMISDVGTATANRFEANNTDDADTPDAAFRVNRTLSTPNSVSGHGFRDQTSFERNTASYAAFDAAVTMAISGTNDHVAGFQSRPSMSGAGTVTHFYNYASAPIFNSGTVTNNYGAYIYGPTGAGTVTYNYGIYVANQTKGTDLNYALYVAGGSHTNYFGCETQNLRNFRVGQVAQYIIGGIGTPNGYPASGYNYNPDTGTYQAADVAVVQKFEGSGYSVNVATAGSAGAACTLTKAQQIDINGNLIQLVNSSAPSLTVNNTLTFELTSNTTLNIKVRGTDGVTRSVSLTLS